MMPFEQLANAIIIQAVKDYREALPKIKGRRRNNIAQATVVECEKFFLSEWFGRMTSLDGQLLIEKIKEEVDNQ